MAGLQFPQGRYTAARLYSASYDHRVAGSPRQRPARHCRKLYRCSCIAPVYLEGTMPGAPSGLLLFVLGSSGTFGQNFFQCRIRLAYGAF